MSRTIARKLVGRPDHVDVSGLQPLAGVAALSGVRVYDVGQGDSIAVLDANGVPVLQLDYGGKQGSPFKGMQPAAIDGAMPISASSLVMLTHWDEDHWSTANRGKAAKSATWLVPRQVTSPRAVRFSTKLRKASCVPERLVGRDFVFRAQNGDAVHWQKIGFSSPDPTVHENCNMTGIALAVTTGSDTKRRVILLPGDAAFHTVPLFQRLFLSGASLAGLVAFHHGAQTHWTNETRVLLRGWSGRSTGTCHVAFSCSEDNGYGHPHIDQYRRLIPKIDVITTIDARKAGKRYIDILF